MKREDIKRIFGDATDEQISAVLDINSADIGSAKKKTEQERDAYKSQLDDATQQLKDFEGVDVADLQGKVTALSQQLADQKADFDKQLADRDFDELLNGAITSSRAKNVKAVRALLDVEAIPASKNQSDDIKAALEKVREENDYLFTSDEPIDNPDFTGKTGGDASVVTREAFARMGYRERLELKKKNPEQYKELKG